MTEAFGAPRRIDGLWLAGGLFFTAFALLNSVRTLPSTAARPVVHSAPARAANRATTVGIPPAPMVAGLNGFEIHDGKVGAFLTNAGIALALPQAEPTRAWGLHWSVVDGREVTPHGELELPARVHRFLGDPSTWQSDLPVYARVRYAGVRDGVDVVVESRRHGLEYSLEVAPGIDPRTLRFRYAGATGLSAVADGRALEIWAGQARLREDGLNVYQELATGRAQVQARFRVTDNATGEYAIELGSFDGERPLLIDPSLSWSTYLGGSGDEYVYRSLTDNSGNTYLAAGAFATGYPTTAGAYDTSFNSGVSDVAITKMSSTGALTWSTYLGGSGSETALDLEIDSSGNVYVTGSTSSANFPAVSSFDTSISGTDDAFVTKISSTGASLVWSAYLGGTTGEQGEQIKVSSTGLVYVCGSTSSNNFPVTGGYDSTFGGPSYDAFVVQISANGLTQNWGTFLGGSQDDDCNGGMALDNASPQNVIVSTTTTSTDFPTLGGLGASAHGATDGTLTEFSSSGALVWSSYIGGSSYDYIADLTTDTAGNIYLTGKTSSSNFPLVSAFDSSLSATDAFVAKINPAGTSILFSSFLGGSSNDAAWAIALDASGNIYVTGDTSSTNFPLSGAVDSTMVSNEVFVSQINGGTLTLGFSTLLGGSGDEYAWGIGAAGTDVYVSGYTNSTDFPMLSGYDMTYGGGFSDVFVTKIGNLFTDTTPPIAGTVNDGAAADVDAQASATTINANWSGFSDAESGITSYAWAIGTTSGGTNIQGFISVGSSTSGTRSGLSLSTGTTYYVTVRATNGVSLTVDATSDGVLVDASAPLTGVVNDGAAADIDLQASTTTVNANWSGFSDAQTGISQYEWAVGTTPGGTSIQGFTSVGSSTSGTRSGLTLTNGTLYYVTVRATNGVGLTNIFSSDGVLVDATAPTGGSVNDGSGADVDVQVSTSTLDANWSGFTDGQSGIAQYEWAIGTTPGGTSIQGFTAVGSSLSASRSGLTLTTGVTYYVTVRATNGVGLTTNASSDGVLVDASAPVAGTVNDGLSGEIDAQVSSTTVSANWSSFSDAQSGIAQYEWAIGVAPGGTSIQGFTSVGAALNAARAGLTLSTGTTYYVTVRATNGVGLTTNVSSDGVLVDTTAPVAGTVNDGVGNDLDTQSSTSSLSANWSVFADAESGVTAYDWAIGTSAGASDVRAFTAVGLATSASVSGLSLTDGARYYITVRAFNAVGLSSTASSNGVTVDVGSVTAGAVNDGAGADVDFQLSTNSLSTNWLGFSSNDGIAQYEWAIGTTPQAQDVQGFTAVGLSTSASASGLTLQSGTRYYVSVRATSVGARQATASSDGITVDASAPLAGVVNDGDAADIDLQRSTQALSASWSGFSDVESGITGYELAVGSSAGAEDLVAFAPVSGASVNLTGLSLNPQQRYYVSVRATNALGLATTVSSDGVTVDPSLTPFSPQDSLAATCESPYEFVAGEGSAVSDPTMHWSLKSGPQGLSVDSQTGRLTWSPGVADVGAHDVTVVAQGLDGTQEKTFSVVVSCVPRKFGVSCGCGSSTGGVFVLLALLAGRSRGRRFQSSKLSARRE